MCSYGLTFQGISYILEKRLCKAEVFSNKENLCLKISQIKEGTSFATIIDAGILKKCFTDLHVIALYVRRQRQGFQFIVCDSEGYKDYKLKKFKQLIPSGYEAQAFLSTCNRQKEYYTCNVFAISDCIAFQKVEGLFDDMLQCNSLENESGEGVFKLNELPASLSSLDPISAQSLGLKYQEEIIEDILMGV